MELSYAPLADHLTARGEQMDDGSESIGPSVDAAHRFGHELRHRRAHAGLTQRELAERLRYSREMVAAVEGGRRYASHEFAVRCDRVLDTGGALARMWPYVQSEQLAADRRRGPRPAERQPAHRPA